MDSATTTWIVTLVSCAVAIFIQYLIAKAFADCAKEKGYERQGYFWACFLLGLIGCCVVAALPDRVLNAKVSELLKK